MYWTLILTALETFLSERSVCNLGYRTFLLCFCHDTANWSDDCLERNWLNTFCAWRLELISDKQMLFLVGNCHVRYCLAYEYGQSQGTLRTFFSTTSIIFFQLGPIWWSKRTCWSVTCLGLNTPRSWFILELLKKNSINILKRQKNILMAEKKRISQQKWTRINCIAKELFLVRTYMSLSNMHLSLNNMRLIQNEFYFFSLLNM